MPLTPQDRSALRRGRVAVYLLFLLSGTAIGTWTARIPAIKQGLGLSDGHLSLGLLGLAAGAITGMQVMGRKVDRHGSAKVMIPVALIQGAVLILPAYAPDLLTLGLSLFVFGAVHGTLDIAMNANAVEVERAWGKPLMLSFHAVFSIGGFLGAAIGGLFARADLSAATTFLTVAVLVTVLALWAARWSLPPGLVPLVPQPDDSVGLAPESRRAARPARAGSPMRGVLFLGLLAFCCLVGEGASADWSTVYLRDALGSSPGFAALAYAAFSIMMTTGRLAGDRLSTRLGPVVLVRCCGVLAAVGLGTALLIGHPIAGVIGFGCFGAGLSCIAPQVFSAAGNRDPARAGQSLARVVGLGYVGFLTGPVLIGGAAELLDLRKALAIPVALSLFVSLTASALRRPKAAGSSITDPDRQVALD
ncbi:MAG: major facilitator superfamily permease [Streptosporangiaceae bacterium]|nr:major facilitator superfamily permease [Streptosporangiaceae bacterium]